MGSQTLYEQSKLVCPSDVEDSKFNQTLIGKCLAGVGAIFPLRRPRDCHDVSEPWSFEVRSTEAYAKAGYRYCWGKSVYLRVLSKAHLYTPQSLILHPTPLGALTQLWAGTSPEGAEHNGKVRSFST